MKKEIETKIEVKYSDSIDCVCCKGNHIFTIETDKRLDDEIYNFLNKNKYNADGKTLKITLEIE